MSCLQHAEQLIRVCELVCDSDICSYTNSDRATEKMVLLLWGNKQHSLHHIRDKPWNCYFTGLDVQFNFIIPEHLRNTKHCSRSWGRGRLDEHSACPQKGVSLIMQTLNEEIITIHYV